MWLWVGLLREQRGRGPTQRNGPAPHEGKRCREVGVMEAEPGKQGCCSEAELRRLRGHCRVSETQPHIRVPALPPGVTMGENPLCSLHLLQVLAPDWE